MKDMQRNPRLSRGTWHRMSSRPTIRTVGEAEIRCRPVSVLAALGACLLFPAYSIPSTNRSVSDITPFSGALERGSSPGPEVSGLVVLRSHDAGTSQGPSALAGDSLICVQTEDLDPFDEDPGHPRAFAEANLIPLGESSSHDSARARFLPFLAIHGLMSRRF